MTILDDLHQIAAMRKIKAAEASEPTPSPAITAAADTKPPKGAKK
jgi:hypothetical protein